MAAFAVTSFAGKIADMILRQTQYLKQHINSLQESKAFYSAGKIAGIFAGNLIKMPKPHSCFHQLHGN